MSGPIDRPTPGWDSRRFTDALIDGRPDAIGHLVWRLEFLEREVARLREALAAVQRRLPPTDAVGRR